MNQIPGWMMYVWVAVTGISLLTSLVLNSVLSVVVVKAWRKLSPLIDDVKLKAAKVGENAVAISTTARSTVETVHTKATNIMGKAEETSVDAANKIKAATTAVTAAYVGIKLASTLKQEYDKSKTTEPKDPK